MATGSRSNATAPRSADNKQVGLISIAYCVQQSRFSSNNKQVGLISIVMFTANKEVCLVQITNN